MANWIGSDGQYLYNLDRFAEVGVEARSDGLYLIKAWSQPSVTGADGTRFPRGDAVTLAELTSMEDVNDALGFLRQRVCKADFQTWGADA
ncbi:MAG: hypothetical protein LC722_05615 [Actinobacteria bacterium]|nr:hypothetical protein [Actinomycetota bacterium]